VPPAQEPGPRPPRSPPTGLAESPAQRVVYGGHTWREGLPMEERTSLVAYRKLLTAFHHAASHRQNGLTQTVKGDSMVAGDGELEANENETLSLKTDNLQRAN
jgi:hypothetical protein